MHRIGCHPRTARERQQGMPGISHRQGTAAIFVLAAEVVGHLRCLAVVAAAQRRWWVVVAMEMEVLAALKMEVVVALEVEVEVEVELQAGFPLLLYIASSKPYYS
jgi:hypothetical protein